MDNELSYPLNNTLINIFKNIGKKFSNQESRFISIFGGNNPPNKMVINSFNISDDTFGSMLNFTMMNDDNTNIETDWGTFGPSVLNNKYVNFKHKSNSTATINTKI